MQALRALILLPVLVLSACGGGEERDISLRSFRDTAGPEEFNVVPGKPLQTPTDLASLPVPTPGGSNRTDQTPGADAVVALGGNPNVVNRPGGAAVDGALLASAGRAGIDPTIRATLEAEDEDFRRRQSRFTSLNPFNIDRYYEAYRRDVIDPRAVADAYRARGLSTPSYAPAE